MLGVETAAPAPVAIVTGASRGAGRGIAIALGRHACTVYVTGRTLNPGDHALAGTIGETAEAVTAAGGRGIAAVCDHGDDSQVAALFDRVRGEQGKLDILVNNAAAVHDELHAPGGFWQKPLHLADMISVGVRSSYVASHHAVPLLEAAGGGLIAFTSASGAVHYSMGPAYGAHKAGIDKLAADMGVDFAHADLPIAAVSIWMGAVLTDRLQAMIDADPGKFGRLQASAESPEFTGHVIWAMFDDPDRQRLNGRTVISAEMALAHGLKDTGDRQPPSYRDTHGVAPRENHPLIIR